MFNICELCYFSPLRDSRAVRYTRKFVISENEFAKNTPHFVIFVGFFYNCTVSYFESFQNQSMISFSGDIKLNK